MEISNAMLAEALIKVKGYDISTVPEDSEIDHTFSADFEKRMSILISSFDKKEKSTSFIRSTLKKAAVIIFIIFISTFSLIMLSPQVRADFKNAVTEFYETHIKFFFLSGSETSDDFTDYESIIAGYIPYGFTLTEKYDEYEAVGYRYENKEEGLAYDIYASLNDGLSVHTDNDKSNIEELLIAGKNAYLISGKNEGKPYSTLIITGGRITVTIYGQLDREEIIRIGKSLEEK